MATITIALRDIVTDPENPIDLTTLSEAEATEAIRRSYLSVGMTVSVVLKEGVATIAMPDRRPKRAKEAQLWYQDAVRSADKGDYVAAIQGFRRVLQYLPNWGEARRNLAMAYLESGNVDEAKNQLIDVLRLDPTDVWGYLLLGNLYAKHRNDFGKAEGFYRTAFAINPNDAILLTNYGALMEKRNSLEQAREFFERAEKADPGYPNSYYGLALLERREGSEPNVLAVLDRMFDTARTADRRSGPLFAEARKMYLEAVRAVAEQEAEATAALVRQRVEEVAVDGGYGIEVREDPSLSDVSATAQIAWKHGRTKHVIRHKACPRWIASHLVSHELEHIVMEQKARAAGTNRWLVTTGATRELALRSVASHLGKLQRMGIAEGAISEAMQQMVHGIVMHVYNTPLDMLIESRLAKLGPGLWHSQFVSLNTLHSATVGPFREGRSRELTPSLIYRATGILNCTQALFLDSLYGGRTAYARDYPDPEMQSGAKRLLAIWETATRKLGPGDEYALVDRFARELGLAEWFGWRQDDGTPLPDDMKPAAEWSPPSNQQGSAPPPRSGGPTNAELLKAKESATQMYLLAALDRFESMPRDAVFAIASEIALKGRGGIDYANSDRQYELDALPGELFTGLQLVCLMYAGFKQIEPTLDTGLDFHEAYAIALALHNSRPDSAGRCE
jgi:tetratricopeptide (TPR) repeat protein